MEPTVSTSAVFGSVSRETSGCRAITMALAATSASWPFWGMAPCAALPWTVILMRSQAAQHSPGMAET